MQFYATFVDLCRKNGVSPSYVAQSLGFSKSAATRWKQDTATPTNKTVKKIADYFGVPTSYFFDNDTNSNSVSDTKNEATSKEMTTREKKIADITARFQAMPEEKLDTIMEFLGISPDD